MNEDDTFLRLKRISFDELHQKIEGLDLDYFNSLSNDDMLKEKFLNSHGWTTLEFIQEVRRLYP